jgi:hypothetical protein
MQEKKQGDNWTVTLTITSIGSKSKESFKLGSATVSALELLRKKHNVSGSYYVKCIDGVCTGGQYGWSLYVNDRYVPLGAAVYKVRGSDNLEFRFEKR